MFTTNTPKTPLHNSGPKQHAHYMVLIAEQRETSRTRPENNKNAREPER